MLCGRSYLPINGYYPGWSVIGIKSPNLTTITTSSWKPLSRASSNESWDLISAPLALTSHNVPLRPSKSVRRTSRSQHPSGSPLNAATTKKKSRSCWVPRQSRRQHYILCPTPRTECTLCRPTPDRRSLLEQDSRRHGPRGLDCVAHNVRATNKVRGE